MNCANHPGVGVKNYCRTCGKPLCANCSRDVRGVIYCENCLADRLQGVQPPPFQAPAGTPPATYANFQSGPNPAVAGMLSFIPGMGSVYAGQYAKGLSYMAIFFLLVWGVSTAHGGGIEVVLGFSIAFFYIFQIVDAVSTAKALQTGKPVPDPLGVGRTFGGAAREEGATGTKTPTAAIVLIGLGFLFLLNTSGLFDFDLGRWWPLILIGLGAWLFVRRLGVVGGYRGCPCDSCRAGGLMGPAILLTLGIEFLLASLDKVSFGRTLPALLIVIGLVKIFQSNASRTGHMDQLPPGVPPPSEMAPPPPQSSEVNNNV